MTPKQELAYFKKYGICPYANQCTDSNGCDGSSEIFYICRAFDKITKIRNQDMREKVQFT